MAATFSADLSTAISRIRQRLGDADITKAQVQDETITAYLETYAAHAAPELRVAYQLALDLAAKWARFGTTTLDDQQQRYETIQKHYMELARTLKAEMGASTPAAGATGAIIVGGIGDTTGPIDAWPWDTESYPLRGPWIY